VLRSTRECEVEPRFFVAAEQRELTLHPVKCTESVHGAWRVRFAVFGLRTSALYACGTARPQAPGSM